MDFGTHALLKKYLGTFKENHSLLVQFDINPDFMDYFENLLAELDGMPNLKMKIEKMKNSSEWESTFSELEFARKLKELNPEFVRTKGSPTPDIKANILGEDVYFEVKMLVENDAASRVDHEILKIESDLIVRIDYGNYETFDNGKADRLIEFIRTKISAKEIGFHSFEDTEIEITKKTSAKTKRTELKTSCSFAISMESIRKKVFNDFNKKLNQFESCNPIFWVIGCQKWQYSTDCFASIVNGLFLLKEAKCLNGVIAIVHDYPHLLINPFAKQQLGSESIRKLNELFHK
jgi:hypothetical protein